MTTKSPRPVAEDDGWGIASLSPAMQRLAVENDGWGPSSPSKSSGSPKLSRKDSWATFKPKTPAMGSVGSPLAAPAQQYDNDNNDYGQDDWDTGNPKSIPCRSWLLNKKCDGWCGCDHPPDQVSQVMTPEHASIKDICKVLGVSSIERPAGCRLRTTPDDKEKLAILLQAQVDYMVSAMVDATAYTPEEMATIKEHLRKLLTKLGVKA